MKLAKFLGAVALLNAGLTLFVLCGAALIMGQWSILFGAISTGQTGIGIAFILVGFVAATALQILAIAIFASEDPWGWGWIALGISPTLIVAWHYGLFLLTLMFGSAIVFQVRKQVRARRQKQADLNDI